MGREKLSGRPAGIVATAKETTSMSSRMEYPKVAPEAARAMLRLEKYVQECGLEAPLLELVRMRASQINGCAYCLDMHSKDARADGEDRATPVLGQVRT